MNDLYMVFNYEVLKMGKHFCGIGTISLDGACNQWSELWIPGEIGTDMW